MFALTVTSKNGQPETGTQYFRGDLIQKIRPTTLNNTATAARFEYLENGENVTYSVTETAAAVAASVTTDMAEAGAQLLSNLVTSVSGASTDAQYPSAKLLYDQLVLKSNLADPTFTGTPRAPTAAANTSTTQVATTANVVTTIAARIIKGTATIGAGGTVAVSAATVGPLSVAVVQKVALGGTVAAGGYKVVMSLGVGFTITALQADGTTAEPANTDSVMYILAV